MQKNGSNSDTSEVREELSIDKNVSKKSKETNIFKHPTLNFSFEYPSEYNFSEFNDEAGETLLIQKDGQGLQVYISDFSADVVFDTKLVRQELAGDKLGDLRDINTIGGFSAVSFYLGDSSSSSYTLEVWFIKEDKLYQITAQPGHEKLLETLINSWKFN